MTAQRNHYEVLGVPPTASTDQIKTKYRQMARMFHPDVAKDKALGQKMFTQINQAYRILADPERRAQYDAVLRSTGAPQAAAAANGTGAAARPGAQNGAAAAAPGSTRPQAGTAADNPALTPQQSASVARLISDADFALMNGDSAAALGHCETALRLDPRNPKGLGLLGDALAAQGRAAEAAAAYRRSLQAQPSPMIQAKLSRIEEIGARTSPPGGVSNGSGPAPSPGRSAGPATAARPPARPAAPAQSGGLLGRLLGKKK